jgi:hypothetical protein
VTPRALGEPESRAAEVREHLDEVVSKLKQALLDGSYMQGNRI